MHLLVAKRIFRYLQGTIKFGLFFRKGDKLDLIGSTDSDYAGDTNDRKNISGYILCLVLKLFYGLQKSYQLLAEFVTVTSCSYQAIWLWKILEELHFE